MTEPRSVSIELPFLPPPELRGNARPAHWRVRYAKTKALKGAVWWRLDQECILPRMERARITYDVWWCGRPIDRDNLIMGLKAALDMLSHKDFQVLPDDSPDCVQDISVRYHRVPHRDQVKVRITVTEVM